MHRLDETAVPALAEVIGLRVKAERQARRWTLDRLAQSSGVSRRMLVNVEKGAVNPSIGTLLRLSDALAVGLPALVAPPETAAVTVVRNGEGAVLWRGEHGGQGVLVAGTEPPDVVELWDWTLASGDRHVSEPHAPGTRELIHVRDGELTVELPDQHVELDARDAATFASDVPHAYTNTAEAPTTFSMTVYEPGLRPRPADA